MYVCARCIDIASVSMMFRMDLGDVLIVDIFRFSFQYMYYGLAIYRRLL